MSNSQVIEAVSLKATNGTKSMVLTAENISAQLLEIGTIPLVGSNSVQLPLGVKGVFTFDIENSLCRKDNLSLSRNEKGEVLQTQSSSLFINGVFKTPDGTSKAGKFYITSENKAIILALLSEGKSELSCNVGYWSTSLRSPKSKKLIRKFTTDDVVIPDGYQEDSEKGWFVDGDGNVITNPLSATA